MRPILVALFGVELPAYFAMLAMGFALATFIGARWLGRLGQDREVVIDLGLAMVVAGVIGSRLLHVIADGYFWDYVHLYRGLERGQTAMKWALPLVLGGAIGNLVDRVRLGYVVDFIHAHWRDKAHWPTFNVADIAITVGIGLMVVEYIIGARTEAQAKPRAKAEPAPAAEPAAEKAG